MSQISYTNRSEINPDSYPVFRKVNFNECKFLNNICMIPLLVPKWRKTVKSQFFTVCDEAIPFFLF